MNVGLDVQSRKILRILVYLKRLKNFETNCPREKIIKTYEWN